ncbi:MAG: BRCT domain-containing protein [Campylobacterota bacterium]
MREIMLDPDTSQPVLHVISAARRADRNVDELIGICKGVIADGEVSQKEAEFLLGWMESNQDAANQWPANILYERIRLHLSDGVLDKNESADLLDLIAQITGGTAPQQVSSMSSTLPLDNPQPDILFCDRVFCLTGGFTVGSRDNVTKLIESKGGKCVKNPTLSTDYLVIGIVGSRDWIHSTHGRKIEAAVMIRESGKAPISIVSEEHWIKFI